MSELGSPRLTRDPLAWIVALVAAIPRLVEPTLVSITPDEGIHGLFAMNIAIAHVFPFVGLPSVGIRNSALFLYLLAIPYTIIWHPLAGVLAVSFINIAAVIMTYVLARRLWGRSAALCAGLLYAVDPWMVMYARNMWPPSCLAVPSLWLIDEAFHWIEDHRPARLVRLVLGIFLMPQIHFSGAAASLWAAIVILFHGRRIRWSALLGGVLLGIATWAPWIYWQHVENHWNDLRGLAGAVEGKQSFGSSAIGALRSLLTLVASNGFDYWFGFDPSSRPNDFSPLLVRSTYWFSYLFAILFALSWLWSATHRDHRLRWLALWVAMPILLLTLLRPESHPHYVLIAFPVPYLLISAFAFADPSPLARLRELAKAKVKASTISAPNSAPLANRTGARMLISMLLVVHLSLQLCFLASWLEFLAKDGPTGQGHFELTYRQRQAAALWALDHADHKRVEMIGPFNGDSPATHWLYTIAQIRGGYAFQPRDERHRFWVDQNPGNEPPPLEPGWTVEQSWRLGPSRIFMLARTSIP